MAMSRRGVFLGTVKMNSDLITGPCCLDGGGGQAAGLSSPFRRLVQAAERRRLSWPPQHAAANFCTSCETAGPPPQEEGEELRRYTPVHIAAQSKTRELISSINGAKLC